MLVVISIRIYLSWNIIFIFQKVPLRDKNDSSTTNKYLTHFRILYLQTRYYIMKYTISF